MSIEPQNWTRLLRYFARLTRDWGKKKEEENWTFSFFPPSGAGEIWTPVQTRDKNAFYTLSCHLIFGMKQVRQQPTSNLASLVSLWTKAFHNYLFICDASSGTLKRKSFPGNRHLYWLSQLSSHSVVRLAIWNLRIMIYVILSQLTACLQIHPPRCQNLSAPGRMYNVNPDSYRDTMYNLKELYTKLIKKSSKYQVSSIRWKRKVRFLSWELKSLMSG